MSDNMRTVLDAAKAQTEIDTRLAKIFTKYFEIESEDRKKDAGYQAWAAYALDVSLHLCNLFLSIKKPNSGRGLRALCDLSFNLHANEFWNRNSAFLMPLITVALNSHRNSVELKLEYKNTSEYAVHDKVMSAAEFGFLDIFSAVLYLVGGPSLMSAGSLPLKMDLAPYFID